MTIFTENKYRNKRTIVDGIEFDSKAEAARYKELLLLEAGGKIEDLTLQPSYELQPAFTDAHGRKHRPICYVADFSYTEVIDPQSIQGRAVAEDVKGVETAVFKLKRKLFAYRWPGVELRVLS